MRAQTVKYFITEGARSFWVNGLMSLASVIIVIACLVVFGIYLAFAVNVQYIVQQIGSQYEVQVFINEKADEARIKALGEQIKVLENVQEVKFVSNDVALKDLQKQLGDSADILDGLESDNPIRNSYKIVMKDLKLSQQVVSEVEKMQDVETIRNNSDAVNSIINITDMIKKFSLGIMLVLGFFSIFIISNTIKLTVFARRRDINIMKFLGSTDWFIRWPFIVEGIIVGLTGGILAFLISIQCYAVIANLAGTFLGSVRLKPFTDVLGQILLLVLGFGVVLGGAGSSISIRRYLKV